MFTEGYSNDRAKKLSEGSCRKIKGKSGESFKVS